jgi:hypothetical protein
VRYRLRIPLYEPEFSRSGQGRDRTADTTIFSRVLYQLSYLTQTPADVASLHATDHRNRHVPRSRCACGSACNGDGRSGDRPRERT